jgi:hypothetical protein
VRWTGTPPTPKQRRSIGLLFQQTPAGIFPFDRELRVTECNDQFMSLLQSQINGTTRAGHDVGRVGVGTGVYALGAPRQIEIGLRLTF